jgi:soluble lytic murein transglycosylase-like protein
MSLTPTRDDLISLARAAAAANDLHPELVCAICEQESAWNPWALRYEPAFFARYVAPLWAAKTISVTESYSRAFSWGLMQVMGQTAREHGFDAALPLSALCDPAAALEIGCRVLAHKIAAAEGNIERALQLWNGGANPLYAEQVLSRAAHYAT